MGINRRREFLAQQGYSTRIIDILESCGVSKHMLWFLSQLKHISGDAKLNSSFSEDITIINKHIESMGRNNFSNLEEAKISAYAELSNKNLVLKKALYTFKDGHVIVMLTPRDLYSEGLAMSNCVGSYSQRLNSKERAILALKNPKGVTVVHFEIMKNGILSQNFEKANMSVRHKYWEYIYEFFKNNSKNIASEKHFGFAWTASFETHKSNFGVSSACVVPTRISKHIGDRNQLLTTVDNSIILKKFDAEFPNLNICEFDKAVFIKKLKDARSDIIRLMDDMISSVEMTDCENLYVSDKIKEILFGADKYNMKEEDYTLTDMTSFDYLSAQEEMPMDIARPEQDMDRPRNRYAEAVEAIERINNEYVHPIDEDYEARFGRGRHNEQELIKKVDEEIVDVDYEVDYVSKYGEDMSKKAKQVIDEDDVAF